jgi:hypothetical protein
MITSERELRHAYESISRMYLLRDRLLEDTSGDVQTKRDEVEGVEGVIRKIERQVADYLSQNPDRHLGPSPTAA